MAQKRMFDKSVVRRDDFLEMSISAQNLYFHLSMDADDDGFVDNWKSIIKITGAKEDDFNILLYKKFIIPFESGIIVIKHWRLNNYIRKDRYTETKYKTEKSQLETNENEEYQVIDGLVYQRSTSGVHRIEENRIEENRIEENRIDNICSSIDEQEENFLIEFNKIWNKYPRKDGKNSAFKHYKSWIKGKKYLNKTVKLTNEEISSAVDNYIKQTKNTEKQYIKMGSTFFNESIIDYIPKETNKTELKAEKIMEEIVEELTPEKYMELMRSKGENK